MEDLRRQINEYKERMGKGEVQDEMGGCVSVRINSGLFGVEWERTKDVLEGSGVDMVILRPADTEDGSEKKPVKRKGAVRDEEAEGEEQRHGKAAKRKQQPEKEVDSGSGKRQTRLSFGET